MTASAATAAVPPPACRAGTATTAVAGRRAPVCRATVTMATAGAVNARSRRGRPSVVRHAGGRPHRRARRRRTPSLAGPLVAVAPAVPLPLVTVAPAAPLPLGTVAPAVPLVAAAPHRAARHRCRRHASRRWRPRARAHAQPSVEHGWNGGGGASTSATHASTKRQPARRVAAPGRRHWTLGGVTGEQALHQAGRACPLGPVRPCRRRFGSGWLEVGALPAIRATSAPVTRDAI